MIAADATSLNELANVVTTWNTQAGNTGANSKFVSKVQVQPTGEIQVTYNAPAVGVAGAKNVLNINPWVRTTAGAPVQLKAALTAGTSGAMDWACASATQVAATKAGMKATAGTLEAKYAPATCR
ncbi:MAG: pilin [Burkholderiaceae bacterium]|nr:pilin [Burkholderiaceae bacterium]